jgi:hypothetical protein
MSKSIHFFGQSVFGQLISLVDRPDVQRAVSVTASDRFCKGFTSWDHLVSMLFCTIGNCQSLREVTAAFLGLKGKTEHLGMKKLPRRSTLSDANRKRTPKFFETIYFHLLAKYRGVISDSRLKELYGMTVYLFDSTTISLFQAIFRCVGRKPVSGKSKGGVKVHTLLNADEKVPEVIWFTDASTHDSAFYDKINFHADALYVFDKGYADHWRFDKWQTEGIHFVTRLRENTTYETLQELEIADTVDPGVIKDEWVSIPLRTNGKIISYTKLRRVAYWDMEQNRLIVCLTNISEMDGGQIAALYKARWQIEILYKQLKQNFPLKYFLGDNQNAIIIQIWCTLIANLLLTVIKQRVKTRVWSFSNLVSFARLHLFNHINLLKFLEAPEKDWIKEIETKENLLFTG